MLIDQRRVFQREVMGRVEHSAGQAKGLFFSEVYER
jgi:hypothetical protein